MHCPAPGRCEVLTVLRVGGVAPGEQAPFPEGPGGLDAANAAEKTGAGQGERWQCNGWRMGLTAGPGR